jgi:transcriptional regulator with XRE-family HTH domain
MAARRNRDKTGLSLFAEELKAARQRAGLSRDEAAAKLGYSASLVSMIEIGHRTPQPDFAERCDEVFGYPGTFTRIEKRLRDLPFPESYRPFVPHEKAAKVLRTFQHSLVPGLLQTPEYARAVLATRPHTSDEEVENLLVARLSRQEILSRADPPLMYALLDEAVLHRPVGQAEVMHGQLLHLVEASRHPDISVQVLPYSAGGHIGLLGAFTIAENADLSAIVFVENANDGQTLEDTDAVSQVMARFDALRGEALPTGPSRALIEEVAGTWATRT